MGDSRGGLGFLKGIGVGIAAKDLSILYASVLLSRVGFGVIIILFPAYISGSTDVQVALALALYPILEAGTALPVGRYCDTLGRRKVFLLSIGLIALLMASIGLTRDIYLVASIHAFMGIGAAGVTVSTLTMITDLTKNRNRGAGMGTFDFMNVGGYAIGLLLGARLQSLFASSLGDAFFYTAAAVAIPFIASAIILKEPEHPSGRHDSTLNPLKALDPQARAILPIWLGVTVLLGIVFFLPRALSTAGIGGGATAELLVAGILVLGMGSVGFGALSDTIGRMRVLLIGVVGLFGLLITLSAVLPQGSAALTRYLPLVGVFALATSALVPTILANVGDRAMTDRRGSAMGLYSVMLSGGTAVGTLSAGIAHQASGLGGVLYSATAIFAIACLCSLVLWVRARGKHEQKS